LPQGNARGRTETHSNSRKEIHGSQVDGSDVGDCSRPTLTASSSRSKERSLLLKQYVREAEIALNDKRAQLDAQREQEKQLHQALERRGREIAALEDDIAQALANGRDDLARFAIRRLLPRQNEANAWRTQIAQLATGCQSLSQRVDTQARATRQSTRATARRAGTGKDATPATRFVGCGAYRC